MEGQSADELIPMSEGVKILYKEAVDNILFLKRQQWTITNHALVGFAAIVAISRGANNVEVTLLTVGAVLAWGYAVACMAHTQYTMTKYRRRLTHIYRKYFHSDEQDQFKLWSDAPTFNYTPMFMWGLIAANTIALAATLYLIWRHAPPGSLTYVSPST